MRLDPDQRSDRNNRAELTHLVRAISHRAIASLVGFPGSISASHAPRKTATTRAARSENSLTSLRVLPLAARLLTRSAR